MHLLFDFDGTLINSFNCVMDKAILLAEEHHYKKLKTHEIEGLRDLSSKEIINFLEIPVYKIPALILKMRKHLYHQMPALMPFDGIPTILEQLYNDKFTIGILTSNSLKNVTTWLHMNNMHHLISFVHTESNYFSKRYLIKKTLNKHKIDRKKVVYIGDETRDIEAANKNNISSVGVTWGYNSETALMKYNPSYIAKKPEDILEWCHLQNK